MLKRLLSLFLLPFALLLTRVSPPPAVPAQIVLTEEEPACSPCQTLDTVCGAAGSRFYIRRPKDDALASVRADAFGMSEALPDNTQPFMDAIACCRAHPDSRLVIPPGAYRFTQTDQIVLSGLRNVFIDGEGAEFIFCTPGRQILVYGCDCLEINGLAIDYDRVRDPIDDVVVIRNADLDTKDAFWESENVTVVDSRINGEFLGWYSKKLRLVNCRIGGTQPLCYCEDLYLENCVFEEDCDLAFEYSEVQAGIIGPVTSVKNPRSGRIIADSYGEIILDGNAKAPADCEIRTWSQPDVDLSQQPDIVEY